MWKFENIRSKSTPKSVVNKLTTDEQGKDVDVDVRMYRGIIDSLLYLTDSTPYTMYSVCLWARF